jgi:hypothetical protein
MFGGVRAQRPPKQSNRTNEKGFAYNSSADGLGTLYFIVVEKRVKLSRSSYDNVRDLFQSRGIFPCEPRSKFMGEKVR